MKIILIALALCSSSAFAVQNLVYCKVKGQLHNVFSEPGRVACAEALYFGTACFTGDRTEVINKINMGTLKWEETWIANATPESLNSIAYVCVDEPYEEEYPASIGRCSEEFFRLAGYDQIP